MFYSHDILGRRGPLGYIWSIAHGKKLSKQKLMTISLSEICRQILAPDVPHSLRLQGILIGGVALVFARLQLYLLEDIKEMMKVLEATNVAVQKEARVATMRTGKDRANNITITDASGELLQVLGPGEGFDIELMTLPDGMLFEDEELFTLVQTLPDPTGASGNTAKESNRLEESTKGKRQSTTKGGPKGVSEQTKEGSAKPASSGPVNHSDIAANLTNGGSAAGLYSHGLRMGAATIVEDDDMFLPVPDELLDDFIVDPPPASPLHEHYQEDMLGGSSPARHQAEPQETSAVDSPAAAELQRDQPEVRASKRVRKEYDAADKPRVTKKGKLQMKAGRHEAIVDRVEDMQIRVVVYRSWTLDTSALIRTRGRKEPIKAAVPDNGTGPCQGPALQVPGVRYCQELLDLYARASKGTAEKEQPKSKNKAGRMSASEAQQQWLHQEQQQQQADEQQEQQEEGQGFLDEQFEVPPEQMDVEQQHFDDVPPIDDMMDMDVEVERLRAAGAITPGGSAGLAPLRLGLVPGSDKPSSAGTAGRSLTHTTANSSGLLSSESENGLLRKKRQHLAPGSVGGVLSPIHDAPSGSLHFGEGRLEDLLPAIDELLPVGTESMFEHLQGPNQHAPFPSLTNPSNPTGITHFNLLESSGMATQFPAKDMISKTTATVINIFRGRFGQQQQQQQQQSAAGGGGDAPAEVSISFFGLLPDLKRSEAVKLFYQVLVTHSTSFVKAEQEEPFGDITITAGRFI